MLFTTVVIENDQQDLTLESVLVDTGSAGTIFQTEQLQQIGITCDLEDEMHRIRGIGGTEFVFSKKLEHLRVGHLLMTDFQIEVGWMDYGFDLQGILGLDFLCATNAVIDLKKLEL